MTTVNIADFPAVQDPVINVFVLLPFFPTLFSHRHKSHLIKIAWKAMPEDASIITASKEP